MDRNGTPEPAAQRRAAKDETGRSLFLRAASNTAAEDFSIASPSAAAAAAAPVPTIAVLREVAQLALPITVSTAAQFSIVTVTLTYVGRLGVSEIGGAATGVMIVNSTAFALATGLCGALDTLLSQIHGDNPKDKRYGRETQRMAMILLCCALPVVLLWYNIAGILHFIGQSEEVVSQTSRFVRVMILGLPPIFGLEVLKRYMQAQHMTTPLTIAVFIGAALNPFVLNFFMFQCGLGFEGAPAAWATVLTGMSVGLLAYLQWFSGDSCQAKWSGWDKEAWSNWRPLLRLGLPCLGITMAEWTTFELNGVASSFTNPTDLAAYSIANQLATLAWTMVSGLTSAVCVVVGNSIGARDTHRAKRAATIGLAMVTTVAVANSLLMVGLGPRLAAPFTSDAAVQHRIGELAPVFATYQFLDCFVSIVNAVSRGIGRQHFVAALTSFCLLCVGVPIGMTGAFYFDGGVAWLMIGPTFGIALSLVVYAGFFYRLEWDSVVPSIDTTRTKTEDDADEGYPLVV
jgi:MATE family multidrug resistance protein